uniref:cellulase family glycosylhydrolase n=1 Tax=Eubacterium cellulosolvens TaxID=29322 RepID=UPI0006860B3A|nr:cellulase family glycosylhydrolase [[Eubacterium] cellulosolvens]
MKEMRSDTTADVRYPGWGFRLRAALIMIFFGAVFFIMTPKTISAAVKPIHVQGTQLVDSSGEQIQLCGVSTHGLQWFPQYVNSAAFSSLKGSWGANVVRLAMYTGEGGYCTGGDKNRLEQLIDTGVKAANAQDMYCIIDWHTLSDSNPQMYQSQAVAFFRKMSAKYASYNNVIYEICNEPCNGTTWGQVKSYADAVVPVIRANDKDALILVGTPNWAQLGLDNTLYNPNQRDTDLEVILNNRVNEKNLMYTCHFYASTHKDWLRARVNRAIDAGLPVFISECSICDASGGGNIDYTQAEAWKNLIVQRRLSFCTWSLCNKAEASALISSGCQKTSGWSDSDLSATGKWFKKFIWEQGEFSKPTPEGAMFRLYYAPTKEHFYTSSRNERNVLVGRGWKYEGIGWYAPTQSSSPVYRLYNPHTTDHHYTRDKHEYDTLIRKYGWRGEGIGWYSCDTKDIPIYRQFCPRVLTGAHNYTADKHENDVLVSRYGWIAEGIGWYGEKR